MEEGWSLIDRRFCKDSRADVYSRHIVLRPAVSDKRRESRKTLRTVRRAWSRIAHIGSIETSSRGVELRSLASVRGLVRVLDDPVQHLEKRQLDFMDVSLGPTSCNLSSCRNAAKVARTSVKA
jgi:hypothetical protein